MGEGQIASPALQVVILDICCSKLDIVTMSLEEQRFEARLSISSGRRHPFSQSIFVEGDEAGRDAQATEGSR